MIAEFNTVTPAPGGTSKGGSKVIIGLLVVGAAIYLGYKYWYKPMITKRNAKKQQA